MLAESLAYKFGFDLVDAWNYFVAQISFCDSHSTSLLILFVQQAENLILCSVDWDF